MAQRICHQPADALLAATAIGAYPYLLLYQMVVYRAFAGKVRIDGGAHY